MSEACDRLWEADAIDEGRLGAADALSFERHRKVCAACRERSAKNGRLRELSRALPEAEPGELELRRLRARVLRDAATTSGATRRVLPRVAAAAMLVAIAAALLIAFGPWKGRLAPAPAEAFAATVTAAPGAAWTRARSGRTEDVSLNEGELVIQVRKQAEGERFRVQTPDGELEVRGTAFKVVVRRGATERVEVTEGAVAVRMRGHAEVLVRAGETWTPAPPAPRPEAVASPDPVASIAPAPAVAPPPSEAARRPLSQRPHAGDAWTADYQAAMALYRAERFSEAADAFHRFAIDHPDSGMVEDATFLEALSLSGAGRHDAAALVATRHLERFPGSFHKKDASILIARAARDRGDCAAAKRVLAPWLSGEKPDPAAARAAGSCNAN